jgi:hypothetical protein
MNLQPDFVVSELVPSDRHSFQFWSLDAQRSETVKGASRCSFRKSISLHGFHSKWVLRRTPRWHGSPGAGLIPQARSMH